MAKTLFLNIVRAKDIRTKLHHVASTVAPSGVSKKKVGDYTTFCVHNKDCAFFAVLEGDKIANYLSTYSFETTRELKRLAVEKKRPHPNAKIYKVAQ